jgi:hypothetical protein
MVRVNSSRALTVNNRCDYCDEENNLQQQRKRAQVQPEPETCKHIKRNIGTDDEQSQKETDLRGA